MDFIRTVCAPRFAISSGSLSCSCCINSSHVCHLIAHSVISIYPTNDDCLWTAAGQRIALLLLAVQPSLLYGVRSKLSTNHPSTLEPKCGPQQRLDYPSSVVDGDSPGNTRCKRKMLLCMLLTAPSTPYRLTIYSLS
jgi:hypothetical protein